MDGGSENANRIMLLLAELIVAKRLTRKIIISRLMPGHTHEDIDALFGNIWTAVRKQEILDPDAFKLKIEQAISGKERAQHIKDVFAVPDYKAYFQPYGFAFSRFAKKMNAEDWTQLVWTFEAVPKSQHFPLGVKVTYRAFAADKTIVLRNNIEKDEGVFSSIYVHFIIILYA